MEKKPYIVEEKAGKKAWCSCGETNAPPYCDGTHKSNGSKKSPMIIEIEENKKVVWCGCRASKTAPYCDGTHKTL